MKNSNQLATHESFREGGEFTELPFDLQVWVNDLTERPLDLNASYRAYLFPSGDIWDTRVGWRKASKELLSTYYGHEYKKSADRKMDSVMVEAEKIIYGDREETYGHPTKNLLHIAQQWNKYLHQKYGTPGNITIEDVCWMMVDLKKCRQMNAPKRDNLVDAIGYLGLIERCE